MLVVGLYEVVALVCIVIAAVVCNLVFRVYALRRGVLVVVSDWGNAAATGCLGASGATSLDVGGGLSCCCAPADIL